jgi:hypothetical protein
MASLSSLAAGRLEVNRPDVRIESMALVDPRIVGTCATLGKIPAPWMTGRYTKFYLS